MQIGLTELNLLRRVLLRAQRYICPICGMVARWRNSNIDHVIPKSAGGPNRLGNYLATHTRCNTLKANRPPTGCELIWLLAINGRLGVEPMRW